METVCVVLGDVINSQDISDRNQFQSTLTETLEHINADHGDAIFADFKTIKGIDEVGGVLTSVRPLAAIHRTMSRRIHPNQIRLGAVVGTVDVNVQTGDVSRMDGPAFAAADRLTRELKDTGETFRLEGIDATLDGLLSDQLSLLDIIRNRWSERRMEVIREYEQRGTQTAAADALTITDQAVSEHIRDVRPVLRIEDRLIHHLGAYPELDTSDP